MDEQQPDEEWVDDRSAPRRAWDRVVNWWNWDRPDWDDVKNLYYRVTGTEPYMDPEIDAIILRIAPQLADDAMPIILRHDPHKFGGFMEEGGMVVVTVEKAAGTHLITFMHVALESAKRGKALKELVARVQADNPDVVVKVDGLLRPSVVVTVTLMEGEATAQALNGIARRAAEVAQQVRARRGGVSGVTVGFDFGEREESGGGPATRKPVAPLGPPASGLEEAGAGAG